MKLSKALSLISSVIQLSKDINVMEEDDLKEHSLTPALGYNRSNHSRSFFTKKLERRLQEDQIELPQSLYGLLDVPFDDFNQEERELYDNRFRPLIHVFVEALRVVYISMGSKREGWEEVCEKLRPTPMKMLAELVLLEEDRLQLLAREAIGGEEDKAVRKDHHWWDKKMF